jgi:hypothetical protein
MEQGTVATNHVSLRAPFNFALSESQGDRQDICSDFETGWIEAETGKQALSDLDVRESYNFKVLSIE